MPKKEKFPHRIDETVAEIAVILARGFLEYKRNRQLAEDSANLESDVSRFEESGPDPDHGTADDRCPEIDRRHHRKA